ncbi:EpuA protein [Geobacillus subterraneus]|uniref:EpuA protein n=2 Tax=Geobacillus TaxID=129337 RepID=A0ABM6AFH0_9BACL|nr:MULTISPECIES: DNA-directed RNA polymerase subunit beta [Geobacillus]AMX85107.1 EpuA protein [Geobacillus subterraneus]KZS25842.1 EpuA protein [Geobacillus subterraneus]OXB85306.1 EpuA protein [Geobacillus uzenensis]QIZ66059.1 DNA-directed RNA polymerase subunit beta [Geobacillus subterraneus]WPZ18262.1 DNA-directed RNA polymerase subunit beta [Geobacillus subterraneus]
MSKETKNEPLSRIARRKKQEQHSAASPSDIGEAAALHKEQPTEANEPPNEPPSEAEPTESKRRFVRTRLIPIWLRLVIVTVLMAICLAAGAVVGYSAIGDGQWLDVFRPSTWQHIIDFVEKGT